MDVSMIAAIAVTALTGGFAKKLGENAAEKVNDLYQMTKTKFKGDSCAEQTLARAEELPDSEERQIALKVVLVEKMTEDPTFTKNVLELVKEAKAEDARNVIAHGERSVVADIVTDSTIITGNGNVVSKRDC